MEKWDILNSRGDPTGRTALRGKTVLRFNEYHLVVHIWVISSSGEFLIQQRSHSKRLMPGEWAATGGAAKAGEDSFTAASRELYEELGISSNRSTLKFAKRIKRRNSFVDVWVINTDIPINNLNLQKNEVASAKWVTKEQLKKMIESGNFHNYGKYYWSVIFEIAEKELIGV